MRKSHRFSKWVMIFGGVCFLFVLFFHFINFNQLAMSNAVKTKFLNSAKAYTLSQSIGLDENQETYELIQSEKAQRMLASIIKKYRQEHLSKATPQVKQTDKHKTNNTSAAKEPAPPSSQKGPSGSSIVYLTIDDGPSATTATIVKILNQYHVTATFFMLEPNMMNYSIALKALVKDGFGLGLHGVTHDKKKFYQSTNTVVGEMKTDQNTLLKITGIKTNLIRVPYGSVPYMTRAFRAAEVQAGFIMWDWNVDSKDWYYKDQRYVTNTIQQLEKMKGRNESPVILIHDLPTTAKYLPQLLDYLKAHHYVFRKIDASLPPVQFR